MKVLDRLGITSPFAIQDLVLRFGIPLPEFGYAEALAASGISVPGPVRSTGARRRQRSGNQWRRR
jgi:hypothetical protein